MCIKTLKEKISIIVPIYDFQRLNALSDLVESVNSQTYKNVELIIIVGRYKDLYYKVSSLVKSKANVPIVVIFNDGSWSLSSQRNFGTTFATGGIIAFLDDDVILCKDWARQVLITFNNPEIIGVTGPVLPLWHDSKVNWIPDELSWIISCTNWFKAGSIRKIRNAWGGNMAFRKDLVDKIEGFSLELGLGGGPYYLIEDVEFSARIQRKTKKIIVYNPNVIVRHKMYSYRITVKYLFRRAFGIGFSRHIVKKLFKNILRDPLESEIALIRSLPKIIVKVFRTVMVHPAQGFRSLKLCIICLFATLMGYLCYPLITCSFRIVKALDRKNRTKIF